MDLTPLIAILLILFILSALTSITFFVVVGFRIRKGRRELKAQLRDFHSDYGYRPKR